MISQTPGARLSADEAPCQYTDGPPGGAEAHDKHRGQHDENVGKAYADGVGVDDKGSRGRAEAQQAKLLLEQAEAQAHQHAHHGTDEGDDAAFVEEDAHDGALVGAQVAQGGDVVALFDDEHGRRADDVEAGHEHDEREEEVGNRLLDLHHVEGLAVLLKAVQHGKSRAGQGAQLLLGRLGVGAGLQPQGYGADAVGLFEEVLGEAERRNQVVVVIALLVHLKEGARGADVLDVETLRGVAQVDPLAGTRRADGHGAEIYGAKLPCQPDAGNAVLHVGGVEQEAAGRRAGGEDAVDVAHTGEVIVHALHVDDDGPAHEEDHRLLLQAVGRGLDRGMTAQGIERGVVGVDKLALGGTHLKLWVEIGVEAADQIVKSVEHRQRAEHGHRGKRHPESRDGGNDVDGVVTFLGEEVAPRDEQGK